MIEKYALTQVDKTVIMKFNFLKLELIIGGYSRHRQFIENIIEQYWDLQTLPEMTFSQKNKLRYSARMVSAKYREIIKKIQDDGALTIEQIRAHGRTL